MRHVTIFIMESTVTDDGDAIAGRSTCRQSARSFSTISRSIITIVLRKEMYSSVQNAISSIGICKHGKSYDT
jgi:hypothetical protein